MESTLLPPARRARVRASALLAGALLLAGCSSLEGVFDGGLFGGSEMSNAAASTDGAALDERPSLEALAAAAPELAAGDRFTFDNPTVTWTVERVEDDRIYWRADNGDEQVTAQNVILPALAWSSAGQGRGRRLITEMSAPFFPLRAGKRVTFNSTVSTDAPPYAWEFTWACETLGGGERRGPRRPFRRVRHPVRAPAPGRTHLPLCAGGRPLRPAGEPPRDRRRPAELHPGAHRLHEPSLHRLCRPEDLRARLGAGGRAPADADLVGRGDGRRTPPRFPHDGRAAGRGRDGRRGRKGGRAGARAGRRRACGAGAAIGSQRRRARAQRRGGRPGAGRKRADRAEPARGERRADGRDDGATGRRVRRRGLASGVLQAVRECGAGAGGN